MRKLLLMLALVGMIFATGAKPDFSRYGCAMMKVGESRTFPNGKPCVIFDGANDKIFWIKMTALPYRTGDPEYDRVYNSVERDLTYGICYTYEYFNSLTSGQFAMGFAYTHFLPGKTIWYLVVGNSEADFCYITDGGPMKVETIIVGRQNDAGSGRDSSKKAPVSVSVNREYRGSSSEDRDYYIVKIPRGKLVKFSITYEDGPAGEKRLVYGLGPGGPTENYYSYCTANHKLISSQIYDGSVAWKSAVFPRVGQTAYCYLKFPEGKPDEPNYVYFPLWVKPPPHYPPPDEAGKPREAYRVPTYKFSFQLVEEK